jgi:Tfp pilus assembly protein PilV
MNEAAAKRGYRLSLRQIVPISGLVHPADYRHKFPSKAKAGFTLLEVAFAAVVLGFALTTAIAVMQRAFLALDTARGLTYAAQIMQNEVEKMRATPWADVSAYSTTPDDPVTIDNSFSSVPYIGSRFTLTRTVSPVHSGMIKVVVKISWRSYDRRLLTRSFVTYYGQNGLYDFISS